MTSLTPHQTTEIQVFEPQKAKVRDAQADAVIDYAKRLKDWSLLEAAIEQKMEDQRLFVEWWQANVTPNRAHERKRRSAFSVDDAFTLTGITQQQVSRWKSRLREPDKYRALLLGALAAKAMQADSLAVHFSTESSGWYTPKEILERVAACLGGIDLDPCSNSAESLNVPCSTCFTREDDGLNREWFGRVYMNPPYGREIDGWVEKLVSEYEASRVTEAIALVPARIDTSWFRRFRNFAVCFVDGRLKFSGHENSAPFPSAIVFLGSDIDRFSSQFHDVGDVWIRWQT